MAHYNKKAFELVGVTYKEYVDWCKSTNRHINDTDNLSEFFRRIKDGKLARDRYTEKIVIKKPRRKK